MTDKAKASLRLTALAFLLATITATASGQPAKPPAPAAVKEKDREKDKSLAERVRSPYEADRPIADKLRTPRETLRTLYFACITCDLFPRMIDDAVACLDLDAMQPRPGPDDAAMLAFGLEDVLQTLALPLTSVANDEGGERTVLHDADGFLVALRRCRDGGWRFSADTLAKLPAMRRAVRDLRKQRPTDLTGYREGFTDPRATLRQFMVDCYYGDFYAASRALDLSSLSDEQRREQGPTLAQQLAFVIQRRGYVFRQEVPYLPDGPTYIWHANAQGRIVLDRVRQPDGKEAWVFTRQTVRAVPRMYEAAQTVEPDGRYVRMGLIIPALNAQTGPTVRKRPEDVPPHLGSPRALLRGFFQVMTAAETNDARLADALEYLDLKGVPPADRATVGGKLAVKLELVLRKLPIDLTGVADDWNAPPLVLGEAQGVRVEVQRQRDGCWRFTEATLGRLPEMFDKLAGKVRGEHDAASGLDSARDTLVTFQRATSRRNFAAAARCLDLSEINVSAREEVGPVLAFKLRYVLDRLDRVYIQEVPDKPDGLRYILYRGELGRIVLDRKADDPGKGQWLFTPATVERIEAMFRAVLGRAPDESQREAGEVLGPPGFGEAPGAWLRLRLPEWAQVRAGRLDLYQWFGLALAALSSWASARLVMAGVSAVAASLLHRGGSSLSRAFVTSTLRPFTWLGAAYVFFKLIAGLDLPVGVASAVFAVEKFLLAGLLGWLALRVIDLSMSVYTDSELLRPHRSLSDLVVPVGMRLAKMAVVLVVATYIIYQVGEIELLGRFLTGLGVAGLAASLAAQDAMKSFFGTLLLIGERAFKIGDRIIVGGQEGVVEQVGFRSTRLRTAEDSLLTIPNAVIAAAPIDNMGARAKRRVSSTLLVHPETDLERLLEFRGRLQAWAAAQSGVLAHTVDVHVHKLTANGVELSLSLFLSGVTAAEETAFRDALNCQVLRLAEEVGVPLSQTPRAVLLRDDGAKPSRAA